MANLAQESQEQYKHNKICKLPSCEGNFKTNRKWQEFCCRSHQAEYWKIYRRDESDIRKQLSNLKKEQEKIKEKIGVI